MQPLTKHREVVVEGVTATTNFGISAKDHAHIKSILRDTLYSDKILAVLREYSANAWDAHRMVGKNDLPIKVVIPVWTDPTLIIEDYGPGLSHEDVFNVFAQYGASTKRDSNDAVGMLGIGSKSGFAYSDTFTIVSRHGGVRRTYVALLDESENDAISLLGEEPCDPTDTGITIQIAVRNEDIGEFHRKAKELFQHFEPRPQINIELPPVPEIQAKLQHGLIFNKEVSYYQGSQWFAVMGCIPYRIDLAQLKGPNGENLISESFQHTAGLLRFDIGEVQINASREALKYSKITKEALVRKFESLLEEYVTVVLEEIEKGGGSSWERRLKAQTLLRLGLGKQECGELATETVRIQEVDLPKSFSLSTHYLKVTEESRFIRRTDIGKKSLDGFHLGNRDYLISPRPKDDNSNLPVEEYSWDEIEKDLQEFIQKNKIDGIPVVDLHTLPWQPKNRRRRANPTVDIKHKVSTFRMINTDTSLAKGKKLSNNWEIEDRVPTDDDVFVIINGFDTSNYSIYRQREEDKTIARVFNITLPEIYGYKTTKKKVIKPEDCVGTHYPDWRKKFFENLPQDEIKEIRENQSWAAELQYRWIFQTHGQELSPKTLKKIKAGLGEDHPIVAFFTQILEARTKIKKFHHSLIEVLNRCGQLPEYVSEARQTRKLIQKTYPLLKVHSIDQLWGEDATEWFRYVKLIDMELVPEKVEE